MYTRFVNGFLVLHLCMVSSIPVQVQRCPKNKAEREATATILCNSIMRYHCLYDTEDMLVVDCIDYKQLPSGNYPVHNSFATSNPIDYKPCPSDKYQPWPAKSYEITECVAKSKCTSEGQIMCSHGNVTTDISCTCDHKNGYALLSKECCFPYGTEDCSCFKKCNNNMEVDINYNCIESSPWEINSTVPALNKLETFTIESIDPSGVSVTFIGGAAIYSVQVAPLSFILILAWYYIFKKKPYDKKWKYAMLVFVTLLFMICCGLQLYFYKEATFLKYRLLCIFLLVICVLTGCCIGICMLCTYEIQEECKVYNEKYEVRVFKLLNAAKNGDLQTIKSLADEDYINMADVDYDSRSALHLAACEGHIDAVKYIVEHNFCNICSTDRWTRTAIDDVMWHTQHGNSKDTYAEIINMIKKHKSQDIKQLQLNIRQFKAMELITAAEAGDLTTLKRFYADGTDMDLANSTGRTALHAAAENGIERVVNYLIDTCKVSPFVRCSRKRPIDFVPENYNETTKGIRKKLQQTMDYLLVPFDEHEECPTDKDVQAVRLLNSAARGDIRRMRAFKKAQYNMNLCDYDKRTALHIAVSENQEHIVEFLLGECDLTEDARMVKDRWGMTPLEAAKSEAIPVVYTIFLKYCKELIDTENDDYRTFQLINAAAKGDLTILKKLNEKKIDMNLMDYDRRTALHLAAAEGKMEAVKYLVETAKVNVSVSDRWNRYPVDEAKNHEIKEFLRISRENRGSPTFHNISSARTTMAFVMESALKGILHLLKDEGYEYFTMDSSDYFGNTPLHVAAAEARLKDVKYLLEKKHVSPFVRNSIMKTPLDLVEDKIEKLGDVNTGRTATKMLRIPSISWENDFFRIKSIISTAMENARTENVTEDPKFVQHTKDEKIFLFLNKAYKGDIRAIRRYMITDKTLVNEVDYDKRSALHLAVAERHHHLIKFLVEQTECPINISAEDRWKVTPMMEAARINDKTAILLLEGALKKQSHI